VKYTAQRGTRDILPSEIGVWHAIEKSARRTFELFDYKEIRTPIFEQTDLFSRSIGSSTDIVSKEMYTFLDRKGRSLTLRPEETAPVVRAAIEHGLIVKENVVKLYYLGPMFRYERPQAGRQRQFHQAGVEAFGSADPMLDVEVISLAGQLFDRLGLKELEIDVNSVGCAACRPGYIEKLKDYFKQNLNNMCDDCRKRFEANPLRILDCKEAVCQKYIEKAPSTGDSLCPECRDHFERVIKGLELSGIKYRVNHRLVRGLDYYTRTTFEVISRQLGAQNAVCGGGRYDTLVEELGGGPTPAIGFAIGLERLVEIVKNVLPSGEKGIELFVAALGDEAKKIAFQIVSKARKAGVSADLDYAGRGLKAQMKAADRAGAGNALIIGDNEIKNGRYLLKDMKTAAQKEVTETELIALFSLL